MAKTKGHVFMRKECRATRDALQLTIQNFVRSSGITFYVGKVWIDILVQKPNMKGDAINLIDSICDAVKLAIGIDDRWFSIRKLDWEIVKVDPKIYVGIGQSIQETHFICSFCGRAQGLSKKAGKHKRICGDCARKAKGDGHRAPAI